MEKLINFLLEYYIAILVILGLIIVTIIGYLVESRQKRKKKELEVVQEKNIEEVKTVEPLPEINGQNATPVVDAKLQQTPTVIDNVIGGDGIYENVSSLSSNEQQPVTSNISNENQVTSNPVEMNNNLAINSEANSTNTKINQAFTNTINDMQNQVVEPQPVNAIPINQSMQQNQSVQPVANNYNAYQTTQQPLNYSNQVPQQVNLQQPVMQGVSNYQTSSVHLSQSQNPVQSQNISTLNNNQINSSVNQNSMVSPYSQQVVGQVPSTPVATIAANQNSQQQVSQPSQQPANSSTTVVSPPSFGMNFVTGNSNSSNNNDSWNL